MFDYCDFTSSFMYVFGCLLSERAVAPRNDQHLAEFVTWYSFSHPPSIHAIVQFDHYFRHLRRSPAVQFYMLQNSEKQTTCCILFLFSSAVLTTIRPVSLLYSAVRTIIFPACSIAQFEQSLYSLPASQWIFNHCFPSLSHALWVRSCSKCPEKNERH